MDEVQLSNYVLGLDQGPIEAGRLDSELARALGVKAGTVVLLSDYTLTKTKFRHPEVTFQDYLKVPIALRTGFAVSESKVRTISVIYLELIGNRVSSWRITLKSTGKAEVFVVSFHRFGLQDARRIYRRAVKQRWLIREHKNQLAQRLLRRASQA